MMFHLRYYQNKNAIGHSSAIRFYKMEPDIFEYVPGDCIDYRLDNGFCRQALKL